jgi:hypothetical protein
LKKQELKESFRKTKDVQAEPGFPTHLVSNVKHAAGRSHHTKTWHEKHLSNVTPAPRLLKPLSQRPELRTTHTPLLNHPSPAPLLHESSRLTILINAPPASDFD